MPSRRDIFSALLVVSGVVPMGATATGRRGRTTGFVNQPESVGWSRTLGGPGDDALHDVLGLDGGHVLLAGVRTLDGGEEAPWLVRVDDAGRPVWSRTFDGGGPVSVAPASVANSASDDAEGRNTDDRSTVDEAAVLLGDAGSVRAVTDGEQRWRRSLFDRDSPVYPVALPDGTVGLGAKRGNRSTTWTWVGRYDPSRDDLRWSTTLREGTGDGYASLVGVVTGAAGGPVVVADVPEGARAWPFRPDGTRARSAALDVPVPRGIARTPDGGFVVGGTTDDGGDSDVVAVHVTPGGTRQWRRTYDPPTTPFRASGVAALSDGGVAVVGDSRGQGDDRSAPSAVVANADGTLRLTVTDSRRDEDVVNAAAPAPGDGLVLAGATSADQYDDEDGWLASVGPAWPEAGTPTGTATRTEAPTATRTPTATPHEDPASPAPPTDATPGRGTVAAPGVVGGAAAVVAGAALRALREH